MENKLLDTYNLKNGYGDGKGAGVSCGINIENMEGYIQSCGDTYPIIYDSGSGVNIEKGAPHLIQKHSKKIEESKYKMTR
jgi:hypothetical protein